MELLFHVKANSLMYNIYYNFKNLIKNSYIFSLLLKDLTEMKGNPY